MLIRIDWWRNYLSKGCDSRNHSVHHYALISNLGYNLQYIEFLDCQCREKDLHSTIQALTFKTFVIISMSVIEGLSFYLLTVNGKAKMRKWKETKEWISNGINFNQTKTRVRTILETEMITPVTDIMTLDWMITKMQKSDLLSLSKDVYGTLAYLRKLRNKVHVYNVANASDTDWNSFCLEDYTKCKKVLGSIIQSKIFSPSAEDIKKLSWLSH